MYLCIALTWAHLGDDPQAFSAIGIAPRLISTTHSVGKFYTQLPSQVYLQFIPWILQSRGVFLNSVVEPKVDGVEGAIPTHSGSDALAKQATEPITLLEKLPPRVSQEIPKI